MTSTEFVSLLNAPPENSIAIVACSKSKQNAGDLAKNLYTSALFKKSFRVANSITSRTFIISAKYGLIPDGKFIDWYDQRIDNLDKEQILNWRKLVESQVLDLPSDISTIYAFAGSAYIRHLEHVIQGRYIIVDFLEGLPLGKRLQQLSEYNDVLSRRDAIKVLYETIERKLQSGSVRSFSEFSDLNLPRKGLYIFIDPEERTVYSNKVPRIVRIGTHGVSLGSSSTLRTRLRAHYGLGTGSGNHRSSIFRLHVGSALIAKGHIENIPSWGKGQSAQKEIRDGEVDHELAVSAYLRRLLVLPIEIDDPSSSKSLRAQVEKTLIGIIAGDGGSIDPPSTSWLGNHSVNSTIRSSGLWNVQHVGCRPSPAEIDKSLRLLDMEPGALL